MVAPVDPRLLAGAREPLGALAAHLGHWLTFTNGEPHRRLRKVMQAGFRQPDVERLRERIRALAEELLERAERAGRMETVADFAYPLPALVIGELLGFPRRHFAMIRHWSRVIIRFFDDPVHQDHDRVVAMHTIFDEAREVVDEILVSRRREPRDDLLSRFVVARDRGEVSDDEIVANCLLMLFAGHETTMNLIGNGLFLLLHHREQARCLTDARAFSVAVDEILRYESPAPFVGRLANRDFMLHGTEIREGEELILLVAAANHDSEVFTDPDRLDLGRHPNPHLAFGHGIHTCLGAPLARLEAQIALELLAPKLDRLGLEDEQPSWRSSPFLRGLSKLPVQFLTRP